MINSNNNLSLIPSALDCSPAIMKGVSSLLVIPPPLCPSSWLPAAQPEGGPRENKELGLKINPLFHYYQPWKRFCKEKCRNSSLKYGLGIAVEFIYCLLPAIQRWIQKRCFLWKTHINSQEQLFVLTFDLLLFLSNLQKSLSQGFSSAIIGWSTLLWPRLLWLLKPISDLGLKFLDILISLLLA